MIISLIAAMDRNRLIGNNNQLPWHLPADFSHFKSITMGKPILMGRKTYDSIGRPLPGRANIVLTRDESLSIDGVECVTDIDQLIHELDSQGGDVDELMVIGGSSVYDTLLSRADRLYITFVDGEFEGDAWFPAISDTDWERSDVWVHEADDKNAFACEFVTFVRKS